MTSEVSCDTNILIYSIDLRDMAKHGIAKRIVDECSAAGCALSLQCLNEFVWTVTRKGIVRMDAARSLVQLMRRSMNVFAVTEADLLRAMDICQQHGIQFFDALLVATVERAGCTILFSEDMQHGQTYGAVTVLNPFKLALTELEQWLS